MDTERIATNISALVKQGKYDEAIDDLIEYLRLYPNDLYVRKLLRGTQIKRFQDPRTKRSAVARFTAPLSVSLASIGNAEKAMLACERALVHNPLDVNTLKALGAAARKAGHLETAILAYETAREQAPKDPGALKALYQTYAQLAKTDDERRQLYVNARQRCAEYLEVKPGDRKAQREMEHLTAQAAIHEGAWERTEAFSEHLAKAPAEAERASDEKPLSADELAALIREVEAHVDGNPDDVDGRKRLADLYTRRGDYAGAAGQYEALRAIDPENLDYAEQHGNLVLRTFDMKIEQARKTLEATPDDAEARGKLEALTRERASFGVEEFRRRLRRRPTDRLVRLSLARYLIDAGEPDDALREFQQCQNDHRFRAEALHGMGRCLEAKGMTDFAIDQLRKAQLAAPPGSATFLEISYELGRMLEKQQRWQEAETEYRKVFELNADFRDVSKRLEHVYKNARSSDSDR